MRLPSSEEKIFFERAASQYQSDLASDTSAQGRGRTPPVIDHTTVGMSHQGGGR